MKKIDGTQNMRRLFSQPNVVPWCGILLPIILIFMVIPPMMMRRGGHIDLPEFTYAQEEFERCYVTVEIDDHGIIWINGHELGDDFHLMEILQDYMCEERFRNSSKNRICLKADKTVRFERIEVLLRAAIKADVQVVGLVGNLQAHWINFIGGKR